MTEDEDENNDFQQAESKMPKKPKWDYSVMVLLHILRILICMRFHIIVFYLYPFVD